MAVLRSPRRSAFIQVFAQIALAHKAAAFAYTKEATRRASVAAENIFCRKRWLLPVDEWLRDIIAKYNVFLIVHMYARTSRAKLRYLP
eukprot:COSAG02_NODE_7344_length_3054_cov_221.886294_2_plen_88_part_00